MLKKHLSLFLMIIGSFAWSQTPNNCSEYTTVGTSGSSYNAGPDTGCNSNVGGQVSGSAAWTGTGCSGTLVSTVTGGPVSCLTLAYTAVNQDDYGTISVDGGGTISLTVVNMGVSGNQVGPFNCGGFYGDVSVTVCSTVPFTTVTLTNTGCSSGWVINCATQTGCGGGGGGGNAGADDLSTITCSGNVDLNALVTGDAGGTWEETTVPASGAFNTGTGVFDANTAAVGIYTFDYIVSGGCSGSDTAEFQIEVTPQGDAAWTVPPAICANDPDFDLSTIVTGDPGGTWSGTGVSGNLFDPTVGSQSLTYTVGTPPCDDVITQTFNVTPSEDPTWISPGTICEADGVIDLNNLITGNSGGTWSGSGVAGSNFNPTGLNGPISVTYTVGVVPCVGSFIEDITVNPDVDPSWTPPNNLCDGSGAFDLTTTITGTAGGTWSGLGVTGSSFDPNFGSQTVTYTVGTAPCEESLALLINVGTTPDPSWTTLSLCASAVPYDLSAQITGDVGGTWSGTGMSGSTFDPAVGAQSITYTVTNGSCTDFSTQTIDVGEPQVDVLAGNVSCFGSNDGTATTTVTAGSGNYTYSWAPGGQTTADLTGLASGTYTITVIDNTYGCSQDVSIDIIEPNEITVEVTATNSCTNNGGEAIANAIGGVGGFTYAWTPSAQTTQIASGLDSAMHTVVATDGNGCTGTDSALVTIYPAFNVTTIADTTIAHNSCLPVPAFGGASWAWNPSYALDCDDCRVPIACPQVATEYCVTAIDTNGCVDSACVLVDIEIVCGDIFVPSAFSPNDDGENDFECIYSDCIDQFTFAIYNRWGEKVFETSDMTLCWDGTWNGKPLNSAVFVYVASGSLINGEFFEQKGNISLIR